MAAAVYAKMEDADTGNKKRKELKSILRRRNTSVSTQMALYQPQKLSALTGGIVCVRM
jgi:hypothetical protein